jgi:hypothetical protein
MGVPLCYLCWLLFKPPASLAAERQPQPLKVSGRAVKVVNFLSSDWILANQLASRLLVGCRRAKPGASHQCRRQGLKVPKPADNLVTTRAISP